MKTFYKVLAVLVVGIAVAFAADRIGPTLFMQNLIEKAPDAATARTMLGVVNGGGNATNVTVRAGARMTIVTNGLGDWTLNPTNSLVEATDARALTFANGANVFAGAFTGNLNGTATSASGLAAGTYNYGSGGTVVNANTANTATTANNLATSATLTTAQVTNAMGGAPIITNVAAQAAHATNADNATTSGTATTATTANNLASSATLTPAQVSNSIPAVVTNAVCTTGKISSSGNTNTSVANAISFRDANGAESALVIGANLSLNTGTKTLDATAGGAGISTLAGVGTNTSLKGQIVFGTNVASGQFTLWGNGTFGFTNSTDGTGLVYTNGALTTYGGPALTTVSNFLGTGWDEVDGKETNYGAVFFYPTGVATNGITAINDWLFATNSGGSIVFKITTGATTNSGPMQASAFYGSGANLTSLPQWQVAGGTQVTVTTNVSGGVTLYTISSTSSGAAVPVTNSIIAYTSSNPTNTLSFLQTIGMVYTNVTTGDSNVFTPFGVLKNNGGVVSGGVLSGSGLKATGLLSSDALATDGSGNVVQATAISMTHIAQPGVIVTNGGTTAITYSNNFTVDAAHQFNGSGAGLSGVLALMATNLQLGATTTNTQGYFTTNAATMGAGTLTWDVSKRYTYVSTNANVTISLTGVPTVDKYGQALLCISNSMASGSTFTATFSGFSILTNGVPCSALLLTNLDSKHQLFRIAVDFPQGNTNGFGVHVYNP